MAAEDHRLRSFVGVVLVACAVAPAVALPAAGLVQFHVQPVEAQPEPWAATTLAGFDAWSRGLEGDAMGAPEGPWPRPMPPAVVPPVIGRDFVASYLILNQGMASWGGDIVLQVPELGVLERAPSTVLLAPFWRSGEPGVPGLLAHVALPVHPGMPQSFTVRVWLETDGQPVGESYERTFDVASASPCASHPAMTFTAGQKRVWVPWDRATYAFTLCNDSDAPHQAAVLLVDRVTNRPLVSDRSAPWSNVFVVPPRGWTPTMYQLESSVVGETLTLPQDIAPEAWVVWDDGALERTPGDTVTFAGLGTPRARMP